MKLIDYVIAVLILLVTAQAFWTIRETLKTLARIKELKRSMREEPSPWGKNRLHQCPGCREISYEMAFGCRQCDYDVSYWEIMHSPEGRHMLSYAKMLKHKALTASPWDDVPDVIAHDCAVAAQKPFNHSKP